MSLFIFFCLTVPQAILGSLKFNVNWSGVILSNWTDVILSNIFCFIGVDLLHDIISITSMDYSSAGKPCPWPNILPLLRLLCLLCPPQHVPCHHQRHLQRGQREFDFIYSFKINQIQWMKWYFIDHKKLLPTTLFIPSGQGRNLCSEEWLRGGRLLQKRLQQHVGQGIHDLKQEVIIKITIRWHFQIDNWSCLAPIGGKTKQNHRHRECSQTG